MLGLIVTTLLPDWPHLDPVRREYVADDVVIFVATARAGAPAHIRLGVSVLTLPLAAFILASRPLNATAATLDWLSRHLSPFASILRFYRSLIALSFYEHPLVESRLGVSRPQDRQAEHRGIRALLSLKEAAR